MPTETIVRAGWPCSGLAQVVPAHANQGGKTAEMEGMVALVALVGSLEATVALVAMAAVMMYAVDV